MGGFLGTLVIAFFLSAYLAQFKWMTCPRKVRYRIMDAGVRYSDPRVDTWNSVLATLMRGVLHTGTSPLLVSTSRLCQSVAAGRYAGVGQPPVVLIL